MASRSRQHRLTAAHKQAFLERLRAGDNVGTASQAVGFNRSTLKDARHKDETFAVAWHDAYETGLDRIEQVVISAALGDSTVGRDRLTAAFFLLNGRRAAVYRQNTRVELAGDGGGPVEVTVGAFERLHTKLAQIAERAGTSPDPFGSGNGDGSAH